MLFLFACSDPPEAPPAARVPPPAEAKAPAPDAPARPEHLGFADFASIAGVSGKSTLDDVQKIWGPGKREGTRIRYDRGPSVGEFMGGLMVDFSIVSEPFIAAHPAPALSLFGATCEEAAQILDFADTVGGYTTCKHYENGWMTDVTVTCLKTVSTIVVVWAPVPEGMGGPDHCD